MMLCPACGAEVNIDAIFCHKCGDRVIANLDSSLAGDGPNPSPNPQPAGRPPTASERFRGKLAAAQDEEDDPERELWQGGYSYKAMINAWLGAGSITLLLLVGGIVIEPLRSWIGLVLLVILLMWAALALQLAYRKFNVRYQLTNERFFHETGILRRVTDRIEVIDMDDITFEQRLMERLTGVGTIKITSSDRTHPVLLLHGIDNVKQVAHLVDSARRKERLRRGIYIESV